MVLDIIESVFHAHACATDVAMQGADHHHTSFYSFFDTNTIRAPRVKTSHHHNTFFSDKEAELEKGKGAGKEADPETSGTKEETKASKKKEGSEKTKHDGEGGSTDDGTEPDAEAAGTTGTKASETDEKHDHKSSHDGKK